MTPSGDVPWLKGSERSFEFLENEEDTVYDRLSLGQTWQ